MLEQEYELPTYSVYVIIAVATIVVGLLLGGVSNGITEIKHLVIKKEKLVNLIWYLH